MYTLAPDAQDPGEVVACRTISCEEWIPDRSIEIGGALSNTGGVTDEERQVVTVFGNRGRTVDDLVRTILHEVGHVADAERLDDGAREASTAAAGYEPGTAGRDPGGRGIEDWARQPSEDFAEVFVAAWSDGRWLPRTRDALPDELVATAFDLAGLDTSP